MIAKNALPKIVATYEHSFITYFNNILWPSSSTTLVFQIELYTTPQQQQQFSLLMRV
jgi:uncharacterized membrane protein